MEKTSLWVVNLLIVGCFGFLLYINSIKKQEFIQENFNHDHFEVYNLKTLNEFKEKKLGVQYLEDMKETSSYFYVIQNVSKMYGDKHAYIEGILWTDSEEECVSMKLKIKSLTEKSAIKYNEYIVEHLLI